MKMRSFMMQLIEHGEGHAVEISELKARNAQLVHENTMLTISEQDAKKAASEAIKEGADMARELATMTLERDTERRQRVALEVALRRAEADAELFPLLIDRGHHVYVAFQKDHMNVGSAKDDGGDYQTAGNMPDYAALIAVPLNPRTFVTCSNLNLIRLPAEPAGKLRVDDDIPF